MKKDNSKKLIIIPVFNEKKTIRKVVREIRKYYQGKLLFIDDGSTDKSIDVIQRCGMNNIDILTHKQNEGYGKSLIDGFNYAISHDYEHVITMDCDCQHEPHHLPEFFNYSDQWDIVSGSRYLKENGSNHLPPEERFKVNKIITNEINKLTGFNLTDSFCGFKAYKVTTLKKIKLTETGYGFPLQVWIQAYKKKLTIKEIPITRIYANLNRTFGNNLDNMELRLTYYKNVIKKELAS